MGQAITPTLDTDIERVKEQLAVAAALRKQGMEGNGGAGYHGGRVFAVGNRLGDIAQMISGQLLGDRAREQQAGIEQRQNQERQDWLSQMPQATDTMDIQQATPEQEFGPTQAATVPTEVPKSPRALQQAMTAWGMKAPRGMEGVQSFALQQAMTAPEKAAEAQQRAADRMQELQVKMMENRATQAEKLEFQKWMVNAQLEGKKDTLRLAAALRPAPAPHTSIAYSPDGKGFLVDMRTGVQTPLDSVGKPFAPAGGARGGKDPTPEQAKAYELESLDELIRRTKELKGSPGLPTVTGPVAGRLPGAAFMTNQDASNAVSTYDKYMEFLQTKGLQDLKSRGISPGSITEKEWPKFVARLTSLDRVKGGKEVNSELDRMMVDAYNTRAKVSGTGDTFHNVDGRIYRLPVGADPKRKSSYEEVR